MDDNRKGFKAFEPGLICRGKQYAENADFEEAGGNICGKGMMHYCVNPFDCLDHYPLVNSKGEISDFATVEALEDPITDDGKKFAAKKLHIGLKLGLPGFVKACVDYIKVQTIDNMPSSKGDAGDAAKIGSSGYTAKIGSSGDAARIDSTGEDAVVCCAGHDNIVKAKTGSWITLSEWAYSEEKKHSVPVCVKTARVDGEIIKADTWYKLVNGEFTEVHDA